MVLFNALGPPDQERETTIATSIPNQNSMEFAEMDVDPIQASTETKEFFR